MVVIRDDFTARGMFWKASLTTITVMLFIPCRLWIFSSKVGMMYLGRRMALLRVWKGLGRSLFPMFLWSWLSLSYNDVRYLVGWFRYSHQLSGGFIGIHCCFDWIQFSDVWLQVKVNSGPRNPSPWKMKWQFSEINLRVKVPSSGQIRSEVSGGAGGGPAAESWLRLDIGDGCLWSIFL